jgi:hypothetical protein
MMRGTFGYLWVLLKEKYPMKVGVSWVSGVYDQIPKIPFIEFSL